MQLSTTFRVPVPADEARHVLLDSPQPPNAPQPSAPADDSPHLLGIASGPVLTRLAPVLATLAAVSLFTLARRLLRGRA